MNHHGAQWEVSGEFTDNTFYGFEIYVSGDYACTLSVSVTVDPVSMDLLSFAASERCGKPSYQQSRSIESVPGMNLPFVGSANYPAWQERGTTSVCDYFSYTGIIRGTPPQYDHWYSICTNSACIDEDSQIRVELYNQ